MKGEVVITRKGVGWGSDREREREGFSLRMESLARVSFGNTYTSVTYIMCLMTTLPSCLFRKKR